MNNAV